MYLQFDTLFGERKRILVKKRKIVGKQSKGDYMYLLSQLTQYNSEPS